MFPCFLQEADVCKAPPKSTKTPLKSTKNGGIAKKFKFSAKKGIEKWDFFNPTTAFVDGIQSDSRKPTEVQKITPYRKLIGNNRWVYFQHHKYEDKFGDTKQYPQIMFVNQYNIAKEQLKDPVKDDVSFFENLSF